MMFSMLGHRERDWIKERKKKHTPNRPEYLSMPKRPIISSLEKKGIIGGVHCVRILFPKISKRSASKAKGGSEGGAGSAVTRRRGPIGGRKYCCCANQSDLGGGVFQKNRGVSARGHAPTIPSITARRKYS